ncbi:MAG TPA: cation-translocating P-type ATPase [Chroococcales cyanobacterium]|jgi:Cd2+/Zn2+-exporting ATPase
MEHAFKEAVITVTGLDCADCAGHVETAIRTLPGVEEASLSFTTAKLIVRFDPEILPEEKIFQAIERFGYGIKPEGSEAVSIGTRWDFLLSRLTRDEDEMNVNALLAGMGGIGEFHLNLATGLLRVVADPEKTNPGEVMAALKAVGYPAALQTARPEAKEAAWWLQKKSLSTMMSGLGLLVGAGLTFSGQGLPANICYLFAILLGGWAVARAGAMALHTSFLLDMNALMTLAILGAMLIGQWEEGATIVFLFSVGNLLQAFTMDRTRNALRKLMGLIPNTAQALRQGNEETVPIQAIAPGEVLVIRPGERIPLDGLVQSGQSSVDQSPITGESLPVEKEEGAFVYAGSINQNGTLEVVVSHAYRDTAFAKIVHLVEEAQSQRAPSQQFVDHFARYYTPTVIGLAVFLGLVPPLLFHQPFVPWFYRALALLVVSCPCALVISTPVAIAAAIGGATRRGLLFKGGAFLEGMGKLGAIAFDKTGTLTLGKPNVTDVFPLEGVEEEELLHIAATLEERSEHPLGEAILRHQKKMKGHCHDCQGNHQHPHEEAVQRFEAIPGRGVRGEIEKRVFLAGNPKLFAGHPWPQRLSERIKDWQREGKTAILVGTKEKILGAIALADEIRPECHEAIAELKKQGIRNFVMLTGDNEGTAARIAEDLGIKEFYAELLPEDKVRSILKLDEKYGRVAMVGDGINDAPALATASIGIAMGAAGTDVALEVADVALMNDDLRAIAPAVELGRRTLRVIHQNIFFSVFVKVFLICLAFPGLLTLWLAVLGDVGTSLLVILNGMRLMRAKK